LYQGREASRHPLPEAGLPLAICKARKAVFGLTWCVPVEARSLPDFRAVEFCFLRLIPVVAVFLLALSYGVFSFLFAFSCLVFLAEATLAVG
jgi:hypothetical protein